jgi:hypothetical protein
LDGDKIGNFDKPSDKIDLTDVNSALVGTPTFIEDASNTFGTLSVTDGTHHASIILFGSFMASGFQTANDGGAGTLVTYQQPVQSVALLAAH